MSDEDDVSELPTEQDFDPHGGDLDAQCAWKNFGGLTVDAAAKKFRENPGYYQEDFMFMGGKAFAFYFPVIEDYLRDLSDQYDGDDRQSWILAHCIKAQFDCSTENYIRRLAPRLKALSQFVRQNVDRFGDDADDQRRIADAWLELTTLLG